LESAVQVNPGNLLVLSFRSNSHLRDLNLSVLPPYMSWSSQICRRGFVRLCENSLNVFRSTLASEGF
jgi:hypothetical protein